MRTGSRAVGSAMSVATSRAMRKGPIGETNPSGTRSLTVRRTFSVDRYPVPECGLKLLICRVFLFTTRSSTTRLSLVARGGANSSSRVLSRATGSRESAKFHHSLTIPGMVSGFARWSCTSSSPRGEPTVTSRGTSNDAAVSRSRRTSYAMIEPWLCATTR